MYISLTLFNCADISKRCSPVGILPSNKISLTLVLASKASNKLFIPEYLITLSYTILGIGFTRDSSKSSGLKNPEHCFINFFYSESFTYLSI